MNNILVKRRILSMLIICFFLTAGFNSTINVKSDVSGDKQVSSESFRSSRSSSTILFSDDFNDNTKDYSKWSETGLGTWYEQNQRTEIYLSCSGSAIGHSVISNSIPITITSDDSIIVSVDMVSSISETVDSGQLRFMVVDGSNSITIDYYKPVNQLMFKQSTDLDWTVIGTRDDGIWSNQIEIFSDRFKVDMDTVSSGWIYTPLFSNTTEINISMSSKLGITGNWMLGYDNVLVTGLLYNSVSVGFEEASLNSRDVTENGIRIQEELADCYVDDTYARSGGKSWFVDIRDGATNISLGDGCTGFGFYFYMDNIGGDWKIYYYNDEGVIIASLFIWSLIGGDSITRYYDDNNSGHNWTTNIWGEDRWEYIYVQINSSNEAYYCLQSQGVWYTEAGSTNNHVDNYDISYVRIVESDVSIWNIWVDDISVQYDSLYYGLIGFWDFNENNGIIVNDIMQNHNGLIYGGANWVNGVEGSAIKFDGANDYIDILNTSDFEFSNQDLTFSAWIQIEDNADDYRNIISLGDTDSYPHMALAKSRSSNLDGRLFFEIYNDSSAASVESIESGPDLPKNNWMFLTGVFEYNNSIRLYLNGVLQENTTDIDYNLSHASDLTFHIGASCNLGGSWPGYYKGLIDEVRIYNRALNETEINLLYQIYKPDTLIAYWDFNEGNGSIVNDSSLNENNGTIYGASWVTGISENALSFDGIDDYVLIPDDDSISIGNQNLTISTWIKPVSDQGTLLSKVEGGHNKEYMLWILPGGEIEYKIENSYDDSDEVTTTDSPILLYQWQHIAVTFEATTFTTKIYHNGIQQNTIGIIDELPLTLDNDLIIGDYGGVFDTPFNGIIDDIRIYNSVLTSNEILSLHQQYTPPTVFVDDDADPSWYDDTHVVTIQEGIYNASAGDTVYVFSGMYSENILINKSLNLIGESEDTTFIIGNGNSSAVDITADYVNVSGFIIINDGRADGIGISITDGDNNQITNTVISDGGIGIKLSNSNYNMISNNILIDNSNSDIIISDVSSFNNISNNFIESNDHYSGILIHLNSDSNNVYSNTIRNQWYGIRISDSSNYNNISSNTIPGHPYGIYTHNFSQNNFIDSNSIYASMVALYITDCQNFNISENIIQDCLDYGLRLINSNNGIIYNNNISRNGGGISLISTHHINISKNNIFDNDFLPFPGSGVSMENCYLNNLIQNNISDKHQNAILINQSNTTIIYNNKIYNSINGINLTFSSDTNIIEGNQISSNNQSGIIIDGIQNLILNNTVTSSGTGISILNNQNNISYNNLISNNNGLSIQSDNNVILTNNISYNNNGIVTGGISANSNNISDNLISFNELSGLSLGVSADYNNISNNNISSNGVGANINGYNHNISSNNITYNQVGLNISGSANNISSNNISINNIGVDL
ncbi:LamG-like jellyroll fold domain-containing protein, partial [Thermoplasmatota archaeon]